MREASSAAGRRDADEMFTQQPRDWRVADLDDQDGGPPDLQSPHSYSVDTAIVRRLRLMKTSCGIIDRLDVSLGYGSDRSVCH